MNNALRAEFRKLMTIRSTYILMAAAIILIFLGSFIGSGFITKTYDKYFILNNGLSTINAVSYFMAIVAVLLMAHEYRYNTIYYTLTMQKSRNTMLVAKLLTVLAFSVLFTSLALLLGIGLALLGASLAGHVVPPQDFSLGPFLIKSLYYCSGFTIGALLLTVFIRNLTGSIVAVFILPNAIEGLLGALLKKNSVYLPFSALEQLTLSPVGSGPISPLKGAVIFTIYLVVGWIIAWQLFLRKDAV